MTGRRSHGRLSALNGVVHQGSIDLFRCESATLRSHWVLVVMDQYCAYRKSRPRPVH